MRHLLHNSLHSTLESVRAAGKKRAAGQRRSRRCPSPRRASRWRGSPSSRRAAWLRWRGSEEPAGSVDQVHLCKNILLPSRVHCSVLRRTALLLAWYRSILLQPRKEHGAKISFFFLKRCEILALFTTSGFQKFYALEVLKMSQVETLCAREIWAMPWTRWETEI
jgi:hypothetical protein